MSITRVERISTIKLGLRKLNSKGRQSTQRKSDQQFNWKGHCFICGNECSDDSDGWSLCEKIVKEKPEKTLDKILELLEGRKDEQSLSIQRRVISCSDLPAVDARYHHQCRKKLDLSSIVSPHDLNVADPRTKLS